MYYITDRRRVAFERGYQNANIWISMHRLRNGEWVFSRSQSGNPGDPVLIVRQLKAQKDALSNEFCVKRVGSCSSRLRDLLWQQRASSGVFLRQFQLLSPVLVLATEQCRRSDSNRHGLKAHQILRPIHFSFVPCLPRFEALWHDFRKICHKHHMLYLVLL